MGKSKKVSEKCDEGVGFEYTFKAEHFLLSIVFTS